MLTAAQKQILLDKGAALMESSTRTGAEARFRPGLFDKRTSYRVVWQWPGVLRVYDAETGDLLASSEANAPRTL